MKTARIFPLKIIQTPGACFIQLVLKIDLAARWLCMRLIHFYQRWLSPALPQSCRFYPSCSHYACDCLEQFSLPESMGLILWRLLKCQPLHPGGLDPAPKKSKSAFKRMISPKNEQLNLENS